MQDNSRGAELGLTGVTRTDRELVTATEIVALALSLLWLIASAVYFLTLPPPPGAVAEDPLRFVVTLIAVFMPVAMIWVAAAAARSARIVREESRRLQAVIDAMRQSYVSERQARGSGSAAGPAAERRTRSAVEGEPAAEARAAAFASTRAVTGARAAPVAAPQVDLQPTLALGSPPEHDQPPLERAEMIRALNFPDDDRDEAGFAALRLALRHRKARQLIQASQDVLTLLSQDGIYMDDLEPDRARPEIWRRFAQGERGRAVASLGGVRDKACLALTANRMREDTVFRDASHHFLRLFDRMLVAFEQEASDEEIVDLSDTRTARAFMLLGRVSGVFD